jgi:tight adherence protein C
MLLVVLGALLLAAAAAALFVRAASMRPAQTLAQIDSYGYRGAPEAREVRRRLTVPLGELAAQIGRAVDARFDTMREDELRTRLLAAGMYETSVRTLIGYRVLATLALPPLWLLLSWSAAMEAYVVLAGVPAAVALGWFGPMRLLKVRAQRRFARIERELPELIDLLVVTVEGGLSFMGSLQLASARMQGALGQELRLTVQEQSMGLAQAEALSNMLERCETPMMRSFVRSVVQGETLGVSIGQIMRNLALEMRKRRRQAAEERAQKAPIKMLFPLVFMIFPAMFVVMLAPAALAIVDALTSA